VLDLARLSDTEAARLDFPESRAKRLSEAIGHPEHPLATSMTIFTAAEKMLLAHEERHARATKDEVEGENQPAGNTQGAGKPSDTARGEESADESVAEPGNAGDEEHDETERLRSELEDAIKEAGLPPRAIVNVFVTCVKILAEKSRSGLMLESLLIASVAQFEVFISRMITSSLRYDPSVMNASDRKFTYEEVAIHESIDSFTTASADAYVESLMYDGMTSWMKFLGRATRSNTDWVNDLLAEVVMRRNVHVHAGGRASAQYIAALGNKGAAVKLGAELPVTAEYLYDAMDRMARAAIVLTQSAVAAVCTSSRGKADIKKLDPDAGVTDSTFDLLTGGRWRAVAPLSAQLDHLVSNASTRERLRANSFHAQKQLDGIESIRGEVEAWDVSAAEDELKLAKHCLLDNIEPAKALFRKLESSGRLSLLELSIWPILEPIRGSIAEEGAETDQGAD
jgi:hypothetical protein